MTQNIFSFTPDLSMYILNCWTYEAEIWNVRRYFLFSVSMAVRHGETVNCDTNILFIISVFLHKFSKMQKSRQPRHPCSAIDCETAPIGNRIDCIYYTSILLGIDEDSTVFAAIESLFRDLHIAAPREILLLRVGLATPQLCWAIRHKGHVR